MACFSNNHKTGAPAQNFIGAMAYERLWFDKDKFAFSFGGGWISNPGGYLVLLPPVNGATATSGSPYFTQFANPGQNFAAYDWQTSFDWMPTQFVTWKVEFTQRGSNVPYFTGPGGITPPGDSTGRSGLIGSVPPKRPALRNQISANRSGAGFSLLWFTCRTRRSIVVT